MRVSSALLPRLFRVWLLLVLAGLGVTGAMAAGAAWRAWAAHAVTQSPSAPPRGFEADDHFPGAALLYADSGVAPLPGTTGTTALPPLPVPAAVARALAQAEPGIVPAQPFSLALASGADRARAMRCLTDAIYYEAASEPDAGQRAVAQVVLNRARHPAFPATVCGVVFQGSERSGCQFSFACDGAMARVPSRAGWARAARVGAAALAGYVYAPVGLATHYHTYAVTPAWNRSLVMTDVVGAHFFHRWKGYWGTAAAFTQRYRGGEPTPGPRLAVAAPVMAGADVASPTPVGQATVSPAIREPGVAAVAPDPEDRLPPASEVLDKWKDSGKPL